MEDQLFSESTNLQTIQSALISIWGDALRLPIDKIALEKSFISLGGDSLSAAFCVMRVRSIFSLELDILDFWDEDSTISEFAHCIFIALMEA